MNLGLAELSSILLAYNQSQLILPDSDYCKNLLKKNFFPKKHFFCLKQPMKSNNILEMLKKPIKSNNIKTMNKIKWYWKKMYQTIVEALDYFEETERGGKIYK
jgi:hypothetical protein